MKQFEYCNMWELDGEMGTIDAKNIIQAREKLAEMYPNKKTNDWELMKVGTAENLFNRLTE